MRVFADTEKMKENIEKRTGKLLDAQKTVRKDETISTEHKERLMEWLEQGLEECELTVRIMDGYEQTEQKVLSIINGIRWE